MFPPARSRQASGQQHHGCQGPGSFLRALSATLRPRWLGSPTSPSRSMQTSPQALLASVLAGLPSQRSGGAAHCHQRGPPGAVGVSWEGHGAAGVGPWGLLRRGWRSRQDRVQVSEGPAGAQGQGVREACSLNPRGGDYQRQQYSCSPDLGCAPTPLLPAGVDHPLAEKRRPEFFIPWTGRTSKYFSASCTREALETSQQVSTIFFLLCPPASSCS